MKHVLLNADLNNMTPLAALNLIARLQQLLNEGDEDEADSRTS